ncbi:MAG: archaemetzincin family Zn-dependent metalloprotease [Candidatus Hodarchaeota archaeon]
MLEDARRINLHLVFFGHFQPAVQDILKEALNDFFLNHGIQFDFKITYFKELIDSFNKKRYQFPSGPHFSYLHDVGKNDPGSLKLGIVSGDLYSDSNEFLNFIFGEANYMEGSALISTKRLNPEFYGLEFKKKLYFKRILKESIHELGHVFKLRHCDDCECIMHFSNCIEDTDIKKAVFCEKCEEKLKKNI